VIDRSTERITEAASAITLKDYSAFIRTLSADSFILLPSRADGA
jgi:hypothetical protein